MQLQAETQALKGEIDRIKVELAELQGGPPEASLKAEEPRPHATQVARGEASFVERPPRKIFRDLTLRGWIPRMGTTSEGP